MKASTLVSTRSVTTKLLTTASVGALLLGLSATAQADNWRYAHEEYEGDVQDVFAYAFKEYIEDNSDHTVQVYRFGELGESDDIMEQTQNGILQFVNQLPYQACMFLHIAPPPPFKYKKRQRLFIVISCTATVFQPIDFAFEFGIFLFQCLIIYHGVICDSLPHGRLGHRF